MDTETLVELFYLHEEDLVAYFCETDGWIC
jgi:hypothetical protein